jgi:hypothetical protein
MLLLPTLLSPIGPTDHPHPQAIRRKLHGRAVPPSLRGVIWQVVMRVRHALAVAHLRRVRVMHVDLACG